jgi:hypothetical protein
MRSACRSRGVAEVHGKAGQIDVLVRAMPDDQYLEEIRQRFGFTW